MCSLKGMENCTHKTACISDTRSFFEDRTKYLQQALRFKDFKSDLKVHFILKLGV